MRRRLVEPSPRRPRDRRAFDFSGFHVATATTGSPSSPGAAANTEAAKPIIVELSQVVERVRDLRVIGAEHLLRDRQLAAHRGVGARAFALGGSASSSRSVSAKRRIPVIINCVD
jgi:hypothetical protein